MSFCVIANLFTLRQASFYGMRHAISKRQSTWNILILTFCKTIYNHRRNALMEYLLQLSSESMCVKDFENLPYTVQTKRCMGIIYHADQRNPNEQHYLEWQATYAKHAFRLFWSRQREVNYLRLGWCCFHLEQPWETDVRSGRDKENPQAIPKVWIPDVDSCRLVRNIFTFPQIFVTQETKKMPDHTNICHPIRKKRNLGRRSNGSPHLLQMERAPQAILLTDERPRSKIQKQFCALAVSFDPNKNILRPLSLRPPDDQNPTAK